jgi:hypothetical protein
MAECTLNPIHSNFHSFSLKLNTSKVIFGHVSPRIKAHFIFFYKGM